MTDRPTRFSIAARDPAFSDDNGNGEHKTPIDSPVMREIGKLTKVVQGQGETQLAIYSAVQAQDERITRLHRAVMLRHSPAVVWATPVFLGAIAGAGIMGALALWRLAFVGG